MSRHVTVRRPRLASTVFIHPLVCRKSKKILIEPILNVQIWDRNKFMKKDGYVGQLSVNLLQFPGKSSVPFNFVREGVSIFGKMLSQKCRI